MGLGTGGLTNPQSWAFAVSLFCTVELGYHRMLDMLVVLTSNSSSYLGGRSISKGFFIRTRMTEDDSTDWSSSLPFGSMQTVSWVHHLSNNDLTSRICVGSTCVCMST